MSYGRLFQIIGSAFEKNLWPKVFVLMEGTQRIWLSLDEQSCLHRRCINPQDPGQVFRTGIWQRTVTEGGYFVLNSSCHWQPVEWVQSGSNMVWFGSFDCESCSCILDSLKSIQKVLRYTREQSITIVQSGKYKGRDERFGGIDGLMLTNWTDSPKFNVCRCASICHLLVHR